jgi:succinate dehydrogenase/fumarate reductase flavoprotein subunit
MTSLEAEVVVVGGGLAGLAAALTARQRGKTPLLIVDPETPSATALSAGRFRSSGPDYPAERHFLDILSTGGYLAERPLAKALAQDALAARAFLEAEGVPTVDWTMGFAVASSTAPAGRVLAETLEQAAGRSGVRTLPAMAWDALIGPDGTVTGLLAYDPHKATWLTIATRSIIVASGGASGIYLRTDHSPEATGDGLAMAFRAGAVLADMEFVQFWPLAALEGDGCVGLPFSRARGMRLIGRGDSDITAKVGLHGLETGETSPALAARLIYEETRPEPPSEEAESPVYLTPDPASGTRAGDRLRVTAAAHHTLGGIVCGDHGQTRVEGLFAAGEAVAATHGANRLPGTGLAEAVVTGRRAGFLASDPRSDSAGRPSALGEVEREARERIRSLLNLVESGAAGAPSPSEVRGRISSAMWRYAALVRTREGLDTAQSELNRIKRALPFAVDAADGRQVREALKALNSLLVAEAVIRSARYRRESRGMHFRADFPERDPSEWSRHVRVKLLSGEMSLEVSQGLGLMEP